MERQDTLYNPEEDQEAMNRTTRPLGAAETQI